MEHRNSREMAAPGHRTLSGTRRTAMRVMHRKSVGIMAVYEQDPVAAEAGTRMLVFESPSRCTRVANFPAEWQRLSDEELVAIRRASAGEDHAGS